MFRFVIQKILWFVPTLLLITALAFLLKVNAPGNPVENAFGMSASLDARQDIRAYEAAFAEKYQALNLHLPTFYFSISTANHPKNLQRIPFDDQRQTVYSWAKKHHNPNDAFRLYEALVSTKKELLSKNTTEQSVQLIDSLLLAKNTAPFLESLKKDSILAASTISEHVVALHANGMEVNAYLPAFHWHGLNNQYHLWLSNLLRGNWGNSYSDNQSVQTKIKTALAVSFTLGITALILTFILGITLGVIAVHKATTIMDKGLSWFSFASFAIPSFLVATLASVFLTTPEYGAWLDWFPTEGIGKERSEFSNWSTFLLDKIVHFSLPVLCISFSLFALIQQQTRNLLLNILSKKEYIKTARAKGLKEQLVIWKHGFRTMLLPMITLFTGLLPVLLSGLVAIEFIFNLPGLGRLMITSLQAKDWPVVLGVLLISALLVMSAYLLADVLYALADPRISYKNKKS